MAPEDPPTQTPAPPPVEPPPAPARRGAGQWAAVVVAALLGGVVASLVTLALVGAGAVAPAATGAPSPRVTAEPADLETAEDRSATRAPPAPVRSVRPAPLVTGVGDIAEDLLPSVAKVDVVRPDRAGSGSAVVLRADGLLATNAHVVEGATTITVTLADGTQLPAELVGADAPSDIAVLRIDRTGLPVPPVAPRPARVGDPAIAIGSPFGLDSTVTAGIVSATERVVATPAAPLVGVLQTDAAINPGNSGGPLVNERGELIGVTTAIFTDTGQTAGVGFAVPAATVVDVADRLIAGQPVAWAQLGVETVAVTAGAAMELGLPEARGARVTAVTAGGPAELAGVVVDDVVVGLGGDVIGDPDDLAVAVRGLAPGSVAAVSLLRAGEPVTVVVTLR